MHKLPSGLLTWLALVLLAACQGNDAPAANAQNPANVPVNAAASADMETERVLDAYLAAAERRVAAPACLQQDQHDWLQATEQRCGRDGRCLSDARVQRARLLEGVVPGVALAPALDAYPQQSAARLLAVVGGTATTPDTAEGMDQLEAVSFEGLPMQAEGGYVLVGEDFDQHSYQDFNTLMGDEAALRARFGDGPIVIRGLLASFPAQALDVGDLAALDQAITQQQRIRVSGWAFPEPDATPALDARRCMFLYRVVQAVQ